MDELVGQGEIGDGVGVLAAVVVVAVAAECLSEAVVIVEHGGDTVEAEAVEVELFEPILAVRQQEVHHLVLAVVEAERIPRRVFAAVVAVEVEVVGAVQTAEAFVLILHGVRVHDVHDDGDAGSVSGIDERTQLVGGAEAAGGREEARHVVAERAVVRVLLDGHDLDGVVAVGGDARQHLGAEFVVAAHLFLLLSHADVAFVDE